MFLMLQIVESLEFLDLAKRLFQEMENIDWLTVSSNTPLNSEIYDPSGLFSSLISSGSSYLGHIKSEHGNSHKELIEKASASTCLTHSSSLAPTTRNQLQTTGLEAHFMLSDKPNSQLQQICLRSTSSVNNPAANPLHQYME